MIAQSEILNARLLIVDDVEFNVRVLDRILKNAGYTSVASTTDPLAVRALHEEHRYDLILLDIEMHALDGFGVMEGLKGLERDAYLPVLVITSQPDHRLRALQAGARDFVSTPFERAEVLARVRNLLEVRLLHVEARERAAALELKVVEVGRLYDAVVAEQAHSIELSLHPGAMVGVEREERLATRWPRSLRLRHPWLQLNLLTAFTAAAVVGLFQSTIDRLLILTVFLPVLADQSGNTGGQALALALRGITLRDLGAGKSGALVAKEALLGLLNGALVGLVAALGMYVVATVQRSPNAVMLAVVVFLAMTVSCLVSGICGAVVPLTLRRVGADPVTASTIFLTTATNVVSMGMLLGLAAALV